MARRGPGSRGLPSPHMGPALTLSCSQSAEGPATPPSHALPPLVDASPRSPLGREQAVGKALDGNPPPRGSSGRQSPD